MNESKPFKSENQGGVATIAAVVSGMLLGSVAVVMIGQIPHQIGDAATFARFLYASLTLACTAGACTVASVVSTKLRAARFAFASAAALAGWFAVLAWEAWLSWDGRNWVDDGHDLLRWSAGLVGIITFCFLMILRPSLRIKSPS